MANMSYCRHENTYVDLKDVVEKWYDFDENNSSSYEINARKDIIKLAIEICEMEGELKITNKKGNKYAIIIKYINYFKCGFIWSNF